ncbi:MAG: VOC family protein [Streptosporangiaceae bacterium]
MEVLSSRVLLRPTDLERSRRFYRDTLGLAVYREFETPAGTGTVFFAGGGLLEVSGGSEGRPSPTVQLWFQVRDASEAHRYLVDRGVRILREPRREPWGLVEMWIADPDGVRICVVQVPDDHPLRYRA